TYTVGATPWGIAAGDLTGDGLDDLAVATASLGKIVTLNGTPQGLTPAKQVLVGEDPRGIAVADIDGDDRPDVVVANFSLRSVGVLRNRGLADFDPVVNYVA